MEVVSLRCDATEAGSRHRGVLFTPADANPADANPADRANRPAAEAVETTQTYHRGGWRRFQVLAREFLRPGDPVPPASLVVSDQSTLIVEPNWSGVVEADGSISLTPVESESSDAAAGASSAVTADATGEAVQMEIVARRMQSIADSMGEVLRRTAISVNVKERLDFSCAVFTGDGMLVANAPHVPVHLGAMGHTVRHIRSTFPDMTEGDCYVSNDPYAGGSHLPDVTVVTPVFCDGAADSDQPSFFVASRAHHAEIGGRTPGSMPPMARCLAEEGVLIRDVALVRRGQSREPQLADILSAGPYPSRNVDENLADLRAQIAAGREGAVAVKQMVARWTLPLVDRLIARLMDVAEQSARVWIDSLPRTEMRFVDRLDDGTEIAVRLCREDARLIIDFTGTSGVHPAGFNATPSIVNSAVLYVMKCFCDSNLPLCDGVMRPIELRIPSGLLDPPADPDPAKCPAVVAGNVETSQRIVDVLLGAIGSSQGDRPVFRCVAASQGTMNNVLMGNERFGYYETIGGGAGATVFGPGADGVHTHMTNTRITDPEVLESRLPIRLREFSIRRGSGGGGKHRGGDGLVREFEFLAELTVSLITNRRTTVPYGVLGGSAGRPGNNLLVRKQHPAVTLPASTTFDVSAGDRLRIETPGGGGWGTASSETASSSG
jgi:5-oxoprolinase (ATP-hydrolysing)